MYELTILSDTELDRAIEELKERELALQTESGQKYIISKMRELIMHLQEMGYVIHANELGLAKIWAKSLSEEFVRLGTDGMKEAIDLWIAEDSNEFHTFPKIPWIKEACAKITGDPRVEKGRRVQAEAEQQMEIDHQKEVEEFKNKHPDLWSQIEKKAAEMQERQENGEEVKVTL